MAGVDKSGIERQVEEVTGASSDVGPQTLSRNLAVPGLTVYVEEGTAAPATVSANLAIPAAAEPGTATFAHLQARPQGFQALVPTMSFTKENGPDDCISLHIPATALDADSSGTAERASASAGSARTACACDRKKNCGFHDGAVCPDYALQGSSFCRKCKCMVEGCAGNQLLTTGYCCNHIFRAASAELQLVRALAIAVAPRRMEEALRPADIQVLDKVIVDYIKKHDILDPAFQVVAVWLEDPGWVETWSKNSLPRSSRPRDLVKALHKTIREMSGRDIPEASYNLRDERCLGFSNCCFQLKVAAEVPPDAAEPVPPSELVYNIGRGKATWRLLKDRVRR